MSDEQGVARYVPPSVHRALRRIDRLVCWAIGVETLGGLAYYAARAGSYTTVLLLVALAAVSRLAHRRRRR